MNTQEPAPALPRLTRRQLLGSLALAGSAAILAACGSAAPAAPSGSQQAASPSTGQAPASAKPSVGGAAPASAAASAGGDWAQVLDAAKKEGVVNLYGGLGQDNRDAMTGPFEKAFPGIKINGTWGPGASLVSRVSAERQADKYLADVLIGPGASGIFPLKPIGALLPLDPALLLPEVTDTSLWLGHHLWYVDSTQPNTTLGFVANVQSLITYNTKLIEPTQFKSHWDLLDPKWKGKIAATDVRKPGAGAVGTRFIYKHPDLGPQFLERLFGEMNLALSNDTRQMVDWVVQGRYPISIFQNPPDVMDAMAQNLPIAMLPGDALKEGAPVGPGGGTVNLMERGPNPNAGKVFVNWLLSKDGQISWQQHVRDNSARTDIPKDGVPTLFLPKAGVDYVNGATEDYAKLSGTVIKDVLDKALAK